MPTSGTLALLGLGLVFGLKHATEVDHVVAVSTIVSEQRNLSRSAIVGALWGLGHTLSLVVVGIFVLALRIAIPDRVANWLEFAVAVMIVALGGITLLRALRGRGEKIHLHEHTHGGRAHVHLHFHEQTDEHNGPAPAHSHAVARLGLKPLLVGAMHGLAGSAALTLLVLTQTGSAAVGLLYLGLFGLGSIGGMLIMSVLIGLPFALTDRWSGIHHGLQTAAGILSILFGIWYGYSLWVEHGLV